MAVDWLCSWCHLRKFFSYVRKSWKININQAPCSCALVSALLFCCELQLLYFKHCISARKVINVQLTRYIHGDAPTSEIVGWNRKHAIRTKYGSVRKWTSNLQCNWKPPVLTSINYLGPLLPSCAKCILINLMSINGLNNGAALNLN